jgi:hypothetical protein
LEIGGRLAHVTSRPNFESYCPNRTLKNAEAVILCSNKSQGSHEELDYGWLRFCFYKIKLLLTNRKKGLIAVHAALQVNCFVLGVLFAFSGSELKKLLEKFMINIF